MRKKVTVVIYMDSTGFDPVYQPNCTLMAVPSDLHMLVLCDLHVLNALPPKGMATPSMGLRGKHGQRWHGMSGTC